MANEKRRLIDANPVIKETESILNFRRQHYMSTIEYETLLDYLKKRPAVDAVEVVHGYWHIDDYDSGELDGYAAFIEVHCSECGYELGAEAGEYGWLYGDPFPLNYCPNCGAKMDGDGNG